MTENTKHCLFSRANSVVTRHIAGEAILVPIAGEVADLRRIFSLNELGAFIWEALDSPATAADLAGRVEGQFDVEHDIARRDTDEFLSRLVDLHLVVKGAPNGHGTD